MRKSNKILAVVMALVMIITAVPMMTAMAGDDEHTHSYNFVSSKEKTCTTDGNAVYKCSCGDTKTIVYEAGHDEGNVKKNNKDTHKVFCDTCEKYIEVAHNWSEEGVEKTKATCEDDGKVEYTCTVCGETKVENTGKGDHDFKTVVKNGDKHIGECAECGKTIEESHTWDKGEITDPKCNAKGSIKYTCTSGCGATKTEEIAAACDMPETPEYADENQHKYVCENGCGKTVTENHNFVVTIAEGKEATCTKTGELTITCVDCKYSYIEKIAAKHVFDGKYESYDSKNHVQKCTAEDCEEVVYSAHTWDEGKVTTAATCKKEGVKTYTCTADGCGATRTESVPKTTEHTVLVYVTTTAATCKDKGVESGVCTTCGETVTKEIPVTQDHDWGEWSIDNAPTTEKEGSRSRVCKVCNKKEAEKIDKLEKEEILLGDVSGDGEITASDARLVLQHVAGLRTLDEEELKRADISEDGSVTAVDARIILQEVAGLR